MISFLLFLLLNNPALFSLPPQSGLLGLITVSNLYFSSSFPKVLELLFPKPDSSCITFDGWVIEEQCPFSLCDLPSVFCTLLPYPIFSYMSNLQPSGSPMGAMDIITS